MPINNDKARIAAIEQQTQKLNDILNEFSPPEQQVPTAFNYVQVVDCSVALYNLLQKYAVCQGAVGSGPFCAPYHLQESSDKTDTVQIEADAEVLARSSPSQLEPVTNSRRSSMYFFLRNTMQEFPFAWWYKCILLQSRKISAKEETIHCDTWIKNSIPEKDMVNRFGLYSEEKDVRSTLSRVNGGVTSDVLRQAMESLKTTLAVALANFTASGVLNEAELQSTDGGVKMRIGAPRDYNMKCYRQSFLPKTVQEFLELGKENSIDCALNMLMWIHNEGANFTR